MSWLPGFPSCICPSCLCLGNEDDRSPIVHNRRNHEECGCVHTNGCFSEPRALSGRVCAVLTCGMLGTVALVTALGVLLGTNRASLPSTTPSMPTIPISLGENGKLIFHAPTTSVPPPRTTCPPPLNNTHTHALEEACTKQWTGLQHALTGRSSATATPITSAKGEERASRRSRRANLKPNPTEKIQSASCDLNSHGYISSACGQFITSKFLRFSCMDKWDTQLEMKFATDMDSPNFPARDMLHLCEDLRHNEPDPIDESHCLEIQCAIIMHGLGKGAQHVPANPQLAWQLFHQCFPKNVPFGRERYADFVKRNTHHL